MGGSCDRGVGVFDHPGEGAGWGEAMQVGGGAHTHTTGLALRARVLHQNTQISVIKCLFSKLFLYTFIFLLIPINEFTLSFLWHKKIREGEGAAPTLTLS